ncbi:MAG: glutathione S-transferase family protein, partial [Methyloligellaceae bacterium]
MPTLIHYPLCPFSRSIRRAAAEGELDIILEDERPWDWRPGFLELNPAGTLPLYRVDEVLLCGAYPISEYLAETGIDETGDARAFSFFPGNEVERGEVRRLIDWFHRKFDGEV